jgi:hypothetical protein
VIIFTLEKKAFVNNAVEQLAAHLEHLNVKAVIVYDRRFPVSVIVETLKKSSIKDRVCFFII